MLRKGGILHWSTLCLLTGSSFTLTSCDSEQTYTATSEDIKMAALEQQLDEVEKRKTQLLSGEIENNFEVPGLGFYHCEAKDFFPYRHGFAQDGKWFANGEWLAEPPSIPSPSTSRPSAVALQKVQQLLEREQELAKQMGTPSGGSSGDTTSSSGTVHHHHHSGMGVGSMMMMYWMLSANRGGFTPGAGFQYAQNQQQGWQQTMSRDRQSVSSYAASNPGYSRLVQQSRSSGTPVSAGSSVRGGFGSKSSSFSSSGS